MSTVEVQSMIAFTVGFIVLMVSSIPECILMAKYENFKDAPIALQVYTVIHIGIIITIVLYVNWLKPSDIYLGI